MFSLVSTAARLGIEPRLRASKAPVLPLDDLAALHTNMSPYELRKHRDPAPTRQSGSATHKHVTVRIEEAS